MTSTDKTETNVSALKKLRDLPRGTQVESRISAIKNLLGEVEIFRTIKNLRWPLGVSCPKCHSHNVILVDPPNHAEDHRQYYECLDCQKSGESGGFNDLTGLNMGDTLGELRQWVLCWYLIGFCSISQIAKVLGLSMTEVLRLAEQGAHLTELNSKKLQKLEQGFFVRSKEKKATQTKKEEIAQDELKTRSESLGKFKPGPKSSA